jgi:hypothetical protein
MTPVILFPHTQIAIPDLEKILARFGELTVCQPWFMEEPFPSTKRVDPLLVHILHPPETLKPEKDFVKLITEYQLWLRQNRDKGYGAFLSASREDSPSEDTPWEIRQLIARAGEKNSSDPHKDLMFKWHLILHLAREFEENRLGAENLLNKLKHQKSPLEGALEEPPPQQFFQDTPLMETLLQVEGSHLRQVFEAWFGLFGEYISDEGSLITLDPQVLIYASEILEPEGKIIKPKSDSEKDFSSRSVSGQPPHNVTCLPQLADVKEALDDPVKKGLSGRTIILMED